MVTTDQLHSQVHSFSSEATVLATSPEIPSKPYFIGCGKYCGCYVEELIFSNPAAFFEVEKYAAVSKNGLARHLKFILSLELRPLLTCKFCGQEKVRFFIRPEGTKSLFGHTSCGHCVSELTKISADSPLYAIEISALRLFPDAEEQKEVGNFMSLLFGLYRKDPQGIHKFFLENYYRTL